MLLQVWHNQGRERLGLDRDGLGEKPERGNTRWKDPWLTEEDQGGAGYSLSRPRGGKLSRVER